MKTNKVIKTTLILFGAFFLTQFTFGQKVIPLYEEKIPNSKPTTLKDSTVSFPTEQGTMEFMVRVITPDLTMYLPEKDKATGVAVIFCPGGGYGGLAIGHEGSEIAKKLQESGIAAFVLKYRLPNSDFMDNKEIVPLQDAQRAIQIVRENATEWNINPEKIGIAGSSAGGHLASTVGTHFMQEHISNPKKTSLRPDFMILNYPVISFADSITHYGSRFSLIGELPKEELKELTSDWFSAEKKLKQVPVSAEKVKEYSNELHVSPNTPPTFITHANDDLTVPIQNSILFIAALQQNRVAVESFFYTKGGHGYGINNPTAELEWIDPCIEWIKRLK